MSRVHSDPGMIGEPVYHNVGTADVRRDAGGRQPVDEGATVATFVDEVTAEQCLSGWVVDSYAALRVSWDM